MTTKNKWLMRFDLLPRPAGSGSPQWGHGFAFGEMLAPQTLQGKSATSTPQSLNLVPDITFTGITNHDH